MPSSTPPWRSITALYREHLAQIGDRLALCELTNPTTLHHHLTHAQLDQQARQLAGALKPMLRGPEPIIALSVPRSADYILAALACWYAGAALMPLDRSLPAPRQQQMLHLARPQLVIHARGQSAIGDLPGLCVEERAAPITARQPSPSQLAYVIFTSGSSGRPKGVAVEHRGLPGMLRAQIEAFAMGPRSRSLWMLSRNFDASLSDIGCALLSGASLWIAPTALLQQPSSLLAVLAAQQISHLDLPPAFLRLLAPRQLPDSMETLILGGEPSPPAVLRSWARHLRVVNVYGPTEATICSSLCRVDPTDWERPYIGEPIGGTRYRIRALDEATCGEEQFDERSSSQRGETALEAADLRTVQREGPERGELVIEGPLLARGYLGDEPLAAERFGQTGGERWYRSGDLVERDERGRIVFLGRVDRQIKHRGLLIAPEEIEACLVELEGVQRAAVIQISRGGRETLVAALEGAPRDDLVNELAGQLPAWMIPQRFFWLDPWPLGSSGKSDLPAIQRQLQEATQTPGSDGQGASPRGVGDDREQVKAQGAEQRGEEAQEPSAQSVSEQSLSLPSPDAMSLSARGVSEQDLEELRSLWAQVLGCSAQSLNPDTDFFAMGADSFMVIELAALAEARGLPLDPQLVHDHPTLAAMARVVASRGEEEADGITTERLAVMVQHHVELLGANAKGQISPEEDRWGEELGAGARSRGAAGETLQEEEESADPREESADRVLWDDGAIQEESADRVLWDDGAILLTGATGFLGTELLARLLQSSSRTIYCLVRGRDDAHARRRLEGALSGREECPAERTRQLIGCDHLEVLCGDLAAPRLGLSTARWRRLSEEVSLVLHLGAQVNLLAGLESLEAVNVGGCRRILEFLHCGRPKRLEYASTLSVFVGGEFASKAHPDSMRSSKANAEAMHSSKANAEAMHSSKTETDSLRVLTEQMPLSRVQRVFGGYAQSKWAAEQLISTYRGGPLGIWRLGLLTGHGLSARAPEDDSMVQVFRGLDALGAAPERSRLTAQLLVDVLPVDRASAMLEVILKRPAPAGREIFHLAAQAPASLEMVIEALERARGERLERLGLPSWQERCRAAVSARARPAIAAASLALCRLFGEEAYRRHRGADLFATTGFRFAMKNSEALLRQANMEAPGATIKLLQRYARRAIRAR